MRRVGFRRDIIQAFRAAVSLRSCGAGIEGLDALDFALGCVESCAAPDLGKRGAH